MSILNEIFEKALHSRIFINRELLLPDYVPDELPHRDKQIVQLGKILAPSLAGYRPSNVFIYGLTGTGKTAVTKYVLRKLIEKAKGKVISAYINCRNSDTNYRVLADLIFSLGKSVPFTGLSTAEVFSRFKNYLDSKRKIMIVVLDEIDYLVKKSGDGVLYHLTRINSCLKHSKLSLIGITNDLKFTEYLDPRVKSSLGEEELVFPPYTGKELEDILRIRAEKALRKDALAPGVIPLCAAIAAKQNGDCRLALDLLLKAAEMAEREDANIVTERHVRLAQREIEKNLVIDVIISMPLHVKLVLLAIYLAEAFNTPEQTTGEIFNVYKDVCRKMGVDPVTQRRVSEIISELDMLGLINAKVVSMGRYGRTKKIKLAASKTSILEGLKSDRELYDILEHIIEEFK
ncbi:MAG: cell division control protein Cdc6 [Thermoprotei archaeon]|nr:MAG: cell division control protein Cdc6 [Thermoprotei archaeon]HDD63987.1 AAA family ATPase [Thermoprotei archaeon]